MKKSFIVFFVLLIMSVKIFAEDIHNFKVFEPIEEFREMLIKNEINEINQIVANEDVIMQMKKFLEEHTILNYSLSILKIDEKDGEFSIKVNNRIEYKKKNGFWTRNSELVSSFALIFNYEKEVYLITNTDIFKEIYSTVQLGYFALFSILTVLPFAVHAFVNKKRKWLLIIMIFQVVGVLVYYFCEVRKKKKS